MKAGETIMNLWDNVSLTRAELEKADVEYGPYSTNFCRAVKLAIAALELVEDMLPVEKKWIKEEYENLELCEPTCESCVLVKEEH